jgi:hypothetical protein
MDIISFFLLPPQITQVLNSTPRQVSRVRNPTLVGSNSRLFACRDTPQRLGLAAADIECQKGPEFRGVFRGGEGRGLWKLLGGS